MTGEKKYLDAALKHGEFISLRMIHPEWGWCPDHFDTKDPRPYSERKTGHDTKGVSGGGSYSDYVSRVQGLLLSHGYGPDGLVGSNGRPDGLMGDKTEAALLDFKRRVTRCFRVNNHLNIGNIWNRINR